MSKFESGPLSHLVAGFLTLSRPLAEATRRSPELRHQLVVFLSDLRPESASEQKNSTIPQMLVRCCLRIRCSQPPSRELSGPVPLFGRKVARSTSGDGEIITTVLLLFAREQGREELDGVS